MGKAGPIRPEFGAVLDDRGLGMSSHGSKGLSRRRPYSAVGGRYPPRWDLCCLSSTNRALFPTRTGPAVVQDERGHQLLHEQVLQSYPNKACGNLRRSGPPIVHEQGLTATTQSHEVDT